MDPQTKITTKLRVMELEKDNFNKLIFFDSTDGFAKLAGHSAIFYAAHFARRLGRRCYLRHDDDYYSPSPEGIVSVKYNSDLLARLAAIDLRPSPTSSSTLIHIFPLKTPFTADDLRRFESELSASSRELESLALPRSPIPTLYTYLRDLNQAFYAALRHLPTLARDLFGRRLFLEAHALLALYVESANEGLTSARLIKLLQNTRHLKYQLQNLDNLHLLPARDLLRLFELLTKIEALLLKITDKTAKNV